MVTCNELRCRLPVICHCHRHCRCCIAAVAAAVGCTGIFFCFFSCRGLGAILAGNGFLYATSTTLVMLLPEDYYASISCIVRTRVLIRAKTNYARNHAGTKDSGVPVSTFLDLPRVHFSWKRMSLWNFLFWNCVVKFRIEIPFPEFPNIRFLRIYINMKASVENCHIFVCYIYVYVQMQRLMSVLNF